MINIHKQIICDNCDKTEGEIWTFRLKYKKIHVCWDCLNELSDVANTVILKELKEREKKKEDEINEQTTRAAITEREKAGTLKSR